MRADFNAFTGTAIGRRNGRRGAIGKPFAIGAQQQDACEHIIPAHLLDCPEMPVEDVLQAITTPQLGGNFAASLLQRFTKRSGKRHGVS